MIISVKFSKRLNFNVSCQHVVDQLFKYLAFEPISDKNCFFSCILLLGISGVIVNSQSKLSPMKEVRRYSKMKKR
jgi:hypothetical protein